MTHSCTLTGFIWIEKYAKLSRNYLEKNLHIHFKNNFQNSLDLNGGDDDPKKGEQRSVKNSKFDQKNEQRVSDDVTYDAEILILTYIYLFKSKFMHQY